MPGRARCQPVALQQQHIGNPAVRKMIGDRSPDDAPTDDNDTGAVGDSCGARHSHMTLVSLGQGILAAPRPAESDRRAEGADVRAQRTSWARLTRGLQDYRAARVAP